VPTPDKSSLSGIGCTLIDERKPSLIAAGANIKAVQICLGHAQITTTFDTYAHVIQELKKETQNF
jgi:hypothetical protein